MNSYSYKRQWREMPQTTKDKIRMAMTGRSLSDETKRKISIGQKQAWSKIPYRFRNNDKNNYTDNNIKKSENEEQSND